MEQTLRCSLVNRGTALAFRFTLLDELRVLWLSGSFSIARFCSRQDLAPLWSLPPAAPNEGAWTMTIETTKETPRTPLEPLLTIEDLERLLRVNRRTIARLCERGELPRPLKVGGSNRWRMRDLDGIL